MCRYVHVSTGAQADQGMAWDLPGARAEGSCELLGMSPGNQMQVLCKKHELLNHLSSTLNKPIAIKAYMQHTIGSL